MSRSNPIDDILGRITAPASADEDKAARADLQAEASDPEGYRPYVTRARAQMGFTLIQANGTRHGFQYHTLRHPKHMRDGTEFLTFTADGMAVILQGQGLVILHAALVRATLAEVREYAPGLLKADNATCIDAMRVIDTRLMTDMERQLLA